MKFSADKVALYGAVKAAKAAVKNNVTIPVLGTLHVQAKAGVVVIRGSDLDSEIAARIPADIADNGAVCIPANLLDAILKKLPNGSLVTLEQDDASVAVRAGRSHFKLHTFPASDFPTLEPAESNHTFALARADLDRLFGKTEFAISNEDARYYLQGVYLHTHYRNGNGEKVLRAVSTDGHRLACQDVALPEGAQGMPGIIVPKAVVANVDKVFDDASEVKVAVSASRIELRTDNLRFRSKVVDAIYPEYQRVVPTNNDKIVTLSVAVLRDATERVAAVSTERGRAVRFDIKAGKVTLSVKSTEYGTSEDEIPADYDGESLTVGFNSKYLIEVLGQIDGDDVEIALFDGGSPTLIRPTTDTGFYSVLMPMRVT